MSASTVLAPLALPLAALAGVALDRWWGEVRRRHPLVGFGGLAQTVERAMNPRPTAGDGSPEPGGLGSRPTGLVAWSVCVLPWVYLAYLLGNLPYLGWGIEVLCLYFALGLRSLTEHGQRVADDLARDDLPAAREHVGWIVSRNTRELDATGVARAGVESVLENGNDAVFATLFWFFLLGGPGAVLFRLANTLDAMWGYRTPRYLRFGWAAARLDDLLNWLPARLTALTYTLLGNRARAWSCWRRQAPAWDSPNAGPVMAAGAGSLGVALGGAAEYHGQLEERPPLGEGRSPQGHDIPRSLALIRMGVHLWLLLSLALALGRILINQVFGA